MNARELRKRIDDLEQIQEPHTRNMELIEMARGWVAGKKLTASDYEQLSRQFAYLAGLQAKREEVGEERFQELLKAMEG